MIVYNRIAVIAILLLSLLTTSCNIGYTRNHADEIRENITDVVNGLRDGLYDSTVVVTINDTLASAAPAAEGGGPPRRDGGKHHLDDHSRLRTQRRRCHYNKYRIAGFQLWPGYRQ